MFASRQRVGRTAQRQIANADGGQVVQPSDDFLDQRFRNAQVVSVKGEGLKKCRCFIDRQVDDLTEMLVAQKDRSRLIVEP